MDYYLNIRILPDAEFSQPLLMNALFAKLHRVLVAVADAPIGVSFPESPVTKQRSLGPLLRLHGTQKNLTELETNPWRKGLGEYTDVSAIAPIPSNCEHRVIKRVHAKSSPECIRRRAVKRQNITLEQARLSIPDFIKPTLPHPFLTLKSQSTGQQFLLFIDQSMCHEQPQPGVFSKYGLSQTATVPWF